MRRAILIVGIIILIGLVFFFFIGRKHDKSKLLENRLSEARLLVREGDLKAAEESYKKAASDFKGSKDIILVLEELADIYRTQNQLLKARELYTDIIRQYPESDYLSEVQEKLWNLNIEIMFSGLITPDSVIYEVKPNDTLNSIAKKFNTTVNLIIKSNNLKNTTIRPDDRLKIITVNFSILVDKSQNILTLKTDNEVMKIYKVSTGKDNCTPVGEFEIINKLKNPVWYKDGKVIAAGDPKNILGSRWMGLSKKDYGIHGTTDEVTIGRQITLGCIRMKNEEIEELYTFIPIGAKVTILD